MKKIIALSILVVLAMTSVPVLAQGTQAYKTSSGYSTPSTKAYQPVAPVAPVVAPSAATAPAKLNLAEIAKNAEIIKQYQILAQDPERLKMMIRIAEAMKKNKN